MSSLNIKAALSLTNGGRALNAIWSSKLPTLKKTILLFLGSQADFNSDFTGFRWHPISRIQESTSISRSQLFVHLSELEDAGYLIRERRYAANTKLPTAYALTDKIFEEHALTLQKREERKEQKALAQQEATLVREPDYPSTPPSPGAGLPQSGSRTTLVREPDIESLDSNPEIKSKIPFTQNPDPKPEAELKPGLRRRPEHQAEARKIIAMIFKPLQGSGVAAFYDRDAAALVADEVLARAGIDALRAYKNQAIEHEMCGKIKLDPGAFIKFMEDKART